MNEVPNEVLIEALCCAVYLLSRQPNMGAYEVANRIEFIGEIYNKIKPTESPSYPAIPHKPQE